MEGWVVEQESFQFYLLVFHREAGWGEVTNMEMLVRFIGSCLMQSSWTTVDDLLACSNAFRCGCFTH